MNSRFGIAAFILLALGAVTAPASDACTTFCYADGGTLIFGRNYDWNVGDGLVLTNKRNVTKRALAEGTGPDIFLVHNDSMREFQSLMMPMPVSFNSTAGAPAGAQATTPRPLRPAI